MSILVQVHPDENGHFLVVKFPNGDEYPTNEVTWTLDQPIKLPVEIIKEIRIDGPELDYVKTLFPTFPWPNEGRMTVNLYGEMAQYIWGNL